MLNNEDENWKVIIIPKTMEKSHSISSAVKGTIKFSLQHEGKIQFNDFFFIYS